MTESTEASPKPEATAIDLRAKPTSRFLSKYQEEIPKTNIEAVVYPAATVCTNFT